MWGRRSRDETPSQGRAADDAREREAARQRAATARLHRALAAWIVLLALLVAALPFAAHVDSGVGAIAASVVACAYGVVTCRMAWLLVETDPRPVSGATRPDVRTTVGDKVLGAVATVLVVTMFSLFPLAAAQHHLPGRGGGDGVRLDFGDAAPALVEAARALGWVATALVALGGPLTAWASTRASRRASRAHPAATVRDTP